MTEENEEEQFEETGESFAGMTGDYDLGDGSEEVVIDPHKNEIVDLQDMTPWEKMVYASEKYGFKSLNPPDKSCKKCSGRGYTGIMHDTQMPIPCKCVFPKLTREEKIAQSMMPQVRMNRKMRRQMEKLARKRMR